MSVFMWHVFLFVGAALGSALTTIWGYRHRNKHAAPQFIAFTVVLTLWNLSLLTVIVASDPTVLFVAAHLEHLFTVLITFTWFYFTASYAGYNDLISEDAGRALIGVAIGAMALFNSIPHSGEHHTTNCGTSPTRSVFYR